MSSPTSRWLTIAMRCLCRNSIGCSMVRMWQARARLMRSTSAASVVEVPEPCGPHTSTRPRLWSLHSITSSGRPRSSGDGMPAGTRRSTAPTESRCTKADTRKRPLPGMACDVASSPSSRNRSRWRCVSMPSTSRRTSEPLSGGQPLHAAQLALEAHDRRRADGEVEVGAAEAHDAVEQVVELHPLGARVGARAVVAAPPRPSRRRRRGPGPYIWPIRRTRSSRTATAGWIAAPRSASRAASTCSSPGSSMATTTPSSRRSSATAR